MQDYAKTTIPTQSIFTIFCGNVTHGPQKKPLGFGGNLYQVTLGLGLRIGGGDSGTSMNTSHVHCKFQQPSEINSVKFSSLDSRFNYG